MGKTSTTRTLEQSLLPGVRTAAPNVGGTCRPWPRNLRRLWGPGRSVRLHEPCCGPGRFLLRADADFHCLTERHLSFYSRAVLIDVKAVSLWPGVSDSFSGSPQYAASAGKPERLARASASSSHRSLSGCPLWPLTHLKVPRCLSHSAKSRSHRSGFLARPPLPGFPNLSASRQPLALHRCGQRFCMA